MYSADSTPVMLRHSSGKRRSSVVGPGVDWVAKKGKDLIHRETSTYSFFSGRRTNTFCDSPSQSAAGKKRTQGKRSSRKRAYAVLRFFEIPYLQ